MDAVALARDVWRRSRTTVLRTPGLLLLSLLMGGALWVFVTDTENPTRVDVFPVALTVQPSNVGDDLAVANTLPSVQVRVAASEDRWEQVTADHFQAFVDLNGLTEREQQVPVSVKVEGIRGVRVVEIIPSAVTVNLEPVVLRQVPVVARLIGTVPVGYEAAETVPDRASVEVSGPQSLVERVRWAAADVNVTGLTVGLSRTVRLTARGEGGGELIGVDIDPPSLGVSIEIAQMILERPVPLVATISGDPAPGFRVTAIEVSPATALAAGTLSALQDLEGIVLPPVDVAGVERTVTRTVSLFAPRDVTLRGEASATVTVTVAPVLGSQPFSLVAEIVGVASGLQARLSEDTVRVVLEGPYPELNALSTSALRATVDAGERGAGTFEVPVDVRVPAGLRVLAVQPPTLSVTLAPPQ